MLKIVKSRPSVSTLEKWIHDLEAKRQIPEEAAAKYKCSSEKLKKEKEAFKVERKELEHQLVEAHSKVKAKAEKSSKVEDQGYRRGYDQSSEFFPELLLTLEPDAFDVKGYFKAYIKYVEDCRQAQAEGSGS